MVMPTRYRERLLERCQGKLVITVDRDQCLLLYPLPDWEEIERKLMRLPTLNEQARRLQRLMVGHASDVELDGHGRVLLPPKLREFAHLERNAILIGQGARFELWDEQSWDERRDEWLSAEDCREMGLVFKVCEPAELMDVTMAHARTLASRPISSLMACKRTIVEPVRALLHEARERENGEFAVLMGAPANIEAMTAFAEKRPPNFDGID